LAGNILLDLKLSQLELRDLALDLGSDVPFFFTGGQAVATGRGELLEETELPTDYWILMVTPRLSISTAKSYAGLNLTLTESKNPFKLSVCRTARELIERLRLSGNDFEGQHRVSFPVLGRIAESLARSGALLVRMSGSGSTMFGLFEAAPDFDNSLITRETDWLVHIVRPVQLPRW
jgi:4-diphosphocytidyl-2-C-methyl-D-erythritol kinase